MSCGCQIVYRTPTTASSGGPYTAEQAPNQNGCLVTDTASGAQFTILFSKMNFDTNTGGLTNTQVMDLCQTITDNCTLSSGPYTVTPSSDPSVSNGCTVTDAGGDSFTIDFSKFDFGSLNATQIADFCNVVANNCQVGASLAKVGNQIQLLDGSGTVISSVADCCLNGATLNGNNLELTTSDGDTYTVDLTALQADLRLTSGTYNAATDAIDLTVSDGAGGSVSTISIPVGSLVPVATDSSISGDGTTGNPLSVNFTNLSATQTQDLCNVVETSCDVGVGLQINGTTGNVELVDGAGDVLASVPIASGTNGGGPYTASPSTDPAITNGCTVTDTASAETFTIDFQKLDFADLATAQQTQICALVEASCNLGSSLQRNGDNIELVDGNGDVLASVADCCLNGLTFDPATRTLTATTTTGGSFPVTLPVSTDSSLTGDGSTTNPLSVDFGNTTAAQIADLCSIVEANCNVGVNIQTNGTTGDLELVDGNGDVLGTVPFPAAAGDIPVTAGTGVDVTGGTSTADPYVVSAAFDDLTAAQTTALCNVVETSCNVGVNLQNNAATGDLELVDGNGDVLGSVTPSDVPVTAGTGVDVTGGTGPSDPYVVSAGFDDLTAAQTTALCNVVETDCNVGVNIQTNGTTGDLELVDGQGDVLGTVAFPAAAGDVPVTAGTGVDVTGGTSTADPYVVSAGFDDLTAAQVTDLCNIVETQCDVGVNVQTNGTTGDLELIDGQGDVLGSVPVGEDNIPVTAGTGVDVTGGTSAADPYVVSAAFDDLTAAQTTALCNVVETDCNVGVNIQTNGTTGDLELVDGQGDVLGTVAFPAAAGDVPVTAGTGVDVTGGTGAADPYVVSAGFDDLTAAQITDLCNIVETQCDVGVNVQTNGTTGDLELVDGAGDVLGSVPVGEDNIPVTAGTGVDVTGGTSAADPYVVSAGFDDLTAAQITDLCNVVETQCDVGVNIQTNATTGDIELVDGAGDVLGSVPSPGATVENPTGNIPATPVDPTATNPRAGDLVKQTYDDGVVLSIYDGTNWTNCAIPTTSGGGAATVQPNTGDIPITLVDPTAGSPSAGDLVKQTYDNGVVISIYDGTNWTNCAIPTGGSTNIQENTGDIPTTPVDPTIPATPRAGDITKQVYDNGFVLSAYNGTSWVNCEVPKPCFTATDNEDGSYTFSDGTSSITIDICADLLRYCPVTTTSSGAVVIQNGAICIDCQ